MFQITGISFDLSDKELFCVEEQDVFDRIYSLVKCFGDLTPGSKLNIVESLRSNFSVLLPNIDSLFRAPASPASGSGCGDGGGVLDRVNSHRNAFIGIGYQVILIWFIDIGDEDDDDGDEDELQSFDIYHVFLFSP
ncbi:hypothetical protein HanXRQr2_Chr05g0235531 [Helianthus annuus]|uniref:Uncharacterized protein n=1 Tax=Helianthus annuus TaxID=4232 RepID=A0A251UU91_HELAN|nr:hypothetical protein HanXRQr2_Chr05g0235531 [Helianthus annuus]KAJ0578911.1 putative condensin subunit 1/Condensin-2 complex subunit D3 [Helianthus annuus]